jgi:inositol phosphorylceramide mannosyltransferase catalytic subunit
MQHLIPKRIIQTGKDKRQPLRLQAMMSTIRLLNPGYEYLFFDDEAVESFVKQHYPQYAEIFGSFLYRIQRYDFFRYLAVHHFGGFYFDLDVLLASGLSDLLESGCVFPFEGLTYSEFLRDQYKMDWQIGNYAFGAAPGHPFLEAVIRNCVRAFKHPAWVKPMMRGIPVLSRTEFLVMNTTGPGLLSRTLAEERELSSTVRVLFPDDVCDGLNWNCFGDLGVHLTDGSWRPKAGFVRRRLALYGESWRMRRLLQQSLRLGKTRHHITNSV